MPRTGGPRIQNRGGSLCQNHLAARAPQTRTVILDPNPRSQAAKFQHHGADMVSRAAELALPHANALADFAAVPNLLYPGCLFLPASGRGAASTPIAESRR
jgi:hypothetical protein